MSGYLLAPRTYTIENTWWQGLYVSSNLAHESAVFGNRRISGGIQAWALVYEDGFVTFQGVSPTLEVKGYIAVNSDGTKLIYSSQPSKFMLQRLDTDRKDIFLVRPVKEDASNGPLVGWQLQGGDDGTQVGIANVMIEGGEWKFTECPMPPE